MIKGETEKSEPTLIEHSLLLRYFIFAIYVSLLSSFQQNFKVNINFPISQMRKLKPREVILFDQYYIASVNKIKWNENNNNK